MCYVTCASPVNSCFLFAGYLSLSVVGLCDLDVVLNSVPGMVLPEWYLLSYFVVLKMCPCKLVGVGLVCICSLVPGTSGTGGVSSGLCCLLCVNAVMFEVLLVVKLVVVCLVGTVFLIGVVRL